MKKNKTSIHGAIQFTGISTCHGTRNWSLFSQANEPAKLHALMALVTARPYQYPSLGIWQVVGHHGEAFPCQGLPVGGVFLNLLNFMPKWWGIFLYGSDENSDLEN